MTTPTYQPFDIIHHSGHLHSHRFHRYHNHQQDAFQDQDHQTHLKSIKNTQLAKMFKATQKNLRH